MDIDLANKKSIEFNNIPNLDFVTIPNSLPATQMVIGLNPEEEERKMVQVEAGTQTEAEEDVLVGVEALLGDCMSQEMVDHLKASHLLVYINTTICSGFDNHCSSKLPSLVITKFKFC